MVGLDSMVGGRPCGSVAMLVSGRYPHWASKWGGTDKGVGLRANGGAVTRSIPGSIHQPVAGKQTRQAPRPKVKQVMAG